jgi:hypothetical protein
VRAGRAVEVPVELAGRLGPPPELHQLADPLDELLLGPHPADGGRADHHDGQHQPGHQQPGDGLDQELPAAGVGRHRRPADHDGHHPAEEEPEPRDRPPRLAGLQQVRHVEEPARGRGTRNAGRELVRGLGHGEVNCRGSPGD